MLDNVPPPSSQAGLYRLSSAPDAVEQLYGERVSRQTVYRWRSQGLHGVRLRCTWSAGSWRTCDRWLRQFFDAVSAAKEGGR